jgi:hypothetical protein
MIRKQAMINAAVGGSLPRYISLLPGRITAFPSRDNLLKDGYLSEHDSNDCLHELPRVQKAMNPGSVRQFGTRAMASKPAADDGDVYSPTSCGPIRHFITSTSHHNEDYDEWNSKLGEIGGSDTVRLLDDYVFAASETSRDAIFSSAVDEVEVYSGLTGDNASEYSWATPEGNVEDYARGDDGDVKDYARGDNLSLDY